MTSAEADVPDLTCVFDALPPARMKKYLDATGSQAGALELYRWNLSASTALWELICHAEVTLRHAVDIALSERHDRLKREGDWVFYAIEDKDGRAELGNCVEDLDTAYTKLCKKVGREPRFKDESAISADDVIAAVDFGFWKYLVAKDRENKLGTPIRRGFDYAPPWRVEQRFELPTSAGEPSSYRAEPDRSSRADLLPPRELHPKQVRQRSRSDRVLRQGPESMGSREVSDRRDSGS